jgi:hypothetical protein
MATTTPNFGWSVPTSTDLVKDGATAIETLGDSIDASLVDLKGGTTGQILAKASATDMDFTWSAAGMSNPMTTTGDTIYSSSGSTPARLGIGTTGQVLTVSGGLPAWGTPAVATESWSLLNAGGTNLTAAATITVSGISGKSRILVIVSEASSVNVSSQIQLILNGDSSALYNTWGAVFDKPATYSASSIYGSPVPNNPNFILGVMPSSTADGKLTSSILLSNCNSTSYKIAQIVGGAHETGTGGDLEISQGFYSGTSAITSVSVISSSGNFDGGKVFIYAA